MLDGIDAGVVHLHHLLTVVNSRQVVAAGLVFLDLFCVVVGIEIDLAGGTLEVAVDGYRKFDRMAIVFELQPLDFAGTASYTIADTATFTFMHPEVWVVAGVSNENPVLLYSLDTGESWNRVQIPELFNGRALFDITYVNEQFYVSGYGVVIYSYSMINPTWNASDFVTSPYGNPSMLKIASNPSGHIVAAASGMLYYTLDGVVWASHYQPGYQFTSVVWYIDHWVAGVTSLLTTYTYFTSTDTINWVGGNNTIQMYDFAIIP